MWLLTSISYFKGAIYYICAQNRIQKRRGHLRVKYVIHFTTVLYKRWPPMSGDHLLMGHCT